MSNEQDKIEERRQSRSTSTPSDTPAFRLPTELPVLPLRDTVLFPEFVHAARGGARELGAAD